MAAARRYDIYRVFELSESSAILRIAEGVKYLAAPILAGFNQLQVGVQVDSVSVDISALHFGKVIALTPPTPEEGCGQPHPRQSGSPPTDVLTPGQRSYCMSRIRGRDTEPEIRLRKTLW